MRHPVVVVVVVVVVMVVGCCLGFVNMRAPKLLRMFSRFVEYMGPNGFVIMRIVGPNTYVSIFRLGLIY